MDDGRPSPEESLDSLKRRVNNARRTLDFASAYVKEVESDERSGRIPSKYPEAHELAIRAHRSATLEYLRVLKIYEDLIARAKAANNGSGPQAEKERERASAQPNGEEP